MVAKLSKSALEVLQQAQERAEATRATQAAQEKIAELEKKLSSETGSRSYYQKQNEEAQRELEAVHDILDALPGAPKRKLDDGFTSRSLTARLAGFFATRSAT